MPHSRRIRTALKHRLRSAPPPANSVADSNRQAYIAAAAAAAREIASIDHEVEVLMGDFDQPPSSLGEGYAEWVHRTAAHAVGETAANWVPPLCRSYLDILDSYIGAWSTTHSRAPCSTRELGIESDLTGPSNAPGRWTAADDLLSRYPLPATDGTGNPTRDANGQVVLRPTALLRRGDSARSRCEVKQQMFEGALRRRGQLLALVPELNERVSASGTPDTVHGVPLYRQMLRVAPRSRDAVFQAQLTASSNQPRLQALQTSIADICAHPDQESDRVFGDDLLLDSFRNCSEESASGMDANWQRVLSDSTNDCRETKRASQALCELRVESRATLAHRARGGLEALGPAMRGAGQVMDLTGCFGAARVFTRGLMNIGGSIAERGLLTGLGESAASAARGLISREALSSAAGAVVNRWNLAFALHGTAELVANREDARHVEADFWAGLATGERREAVRQAAHGDVRRLVGNLVAGSIVAHAMTGGLLAGGREPGSTTGSFMTPELNRLYERSTGVTITGQRSTHPEVQAGMDAAREPFVRAMRTRLAERLGVPVSGLSGLDHEFFADLSARSQQLDENVFMTPELSALLRVAEESGSAHPQNRRVFSEAMKRRLIERLGIPAPESDEYFRNFRFEDFVRVADESGDLTSLIQSAENRFQIGSNPAERTSLRRMVARLRQRYGAYPNWRERIAAFLEDFRDRIRRGRCPRA